MAFVSMLALSLVFCILAFGIFCLILTAVMLFFNRKRRKKWIKITSIVTGVLAVLNLGIVAVLVLLMLAAG